MLNFVFQIHLYYNKYCAKLFFFRKNFEVFFDKGGYFFKPPLVKHLGKGKQVHLSIILVKVTGHIILHKPGDSEPPAFGYGLADTELPG